MARIGLRFPRKLHLYQYAQHKGRRHWLANREEAVVYVLSHELRHFWQNYGKYKGLKFPLGRAPNSKGLFSGVDTESYAIHKLREWRQVGASNRPSNRRILFSTPVLEICSKRQMLGTLPCLAYLKLLITQGRL